jgi:hypothetical protein
MTTLSNLKNEFSKYIFKEFNANLPIQPFQSRYFHSRIHENENSKRLFFYSLPPEISSFDLSLIEPEGIKIIIK